MNQQTIYFVYNKNKEENNDWVIKQINNLIVKNSLVELIEFYTFI